ncbi:2-amino-4-hydroxy-6-hydroxymethyldihydropteridin epyrophosphokinase [Ferrimonas balearica DSM 9799]|uniref:2-amino-4-hydroxy-6-hydroxymethyldihydropteridine pyrophosphokinase n=1 Tax=Ferrimonas balearica (strain DSM 9799 / CCM 4581 / KCTC 23876 / PAT) TaxID=550540 RepID=E1SVW2_FERBD|nr:2-amino-4-hydroxy-6-hydroxymethyldihydropteridine diphosphokinase [Ferrimonas balearica]ADN77413.1 2-amino-4-hydroxy-6-hydroxymethyldihydropteridin epyrophosphokinase [Ferrimonas balearica DSM 9799]
MIRAYIALGSNLEAPAQQLQQALSALDELADTRLVACSSFYRSPPMAGMDQPDYLNAVAAIDTSLAPLALLDALQGIEQQQGRERHTRWGARTLDLDMVLYGDQAIEHERLTVPHYGMAERAFVLIPLFELAPQLTLPDGRQLATLLAQCPPQTLFIR